MLGFGALYSYIRRQIGLRSDAADAGGSLHAKIASIYAKISLGPIKSIQRGTIAIAQNESSSAVTISAVNTSKAFVSYLGSTTNWSEPDGSSPNRTYTRIELTNSVTVTATREFAAGAGPIVGFEVIEYV